MSVRFSLHDTPVPDGKENKKHRHARVIRDESVGMEKLCKLISSQTSFSPADVKGMLVAFNFWLDFYMRQGSSVNLEGIGLFYPTIKTSIRENDEGEERIRIRLDTVGFRCCPDLRKKLRHVRIEEVKTKRRRKDAPEKRQEKILEYLKEHFYACCTDIMCLNACNQHIALADLNALILDGKVKRIGKARQTLYVLFFQ